MSPWLSIVLLGIAIAGYAWMIPKGGTKDKENEFVSEAAYDRLLEDLETENRELVDAVAQFKREQDETVFKLSQRVVDMEQTMRQWRDQPPPAAEPAAPVVATFVSPATAFAGSPAAGAASTAPFVPAAEPVDVVKEEPSLVLPPTTIRGRYPELLALHEKGRTVEQIAKAMGMNKGEVQLIVQLVRREEGRHA